MMPIWVGDLITLLVIAKGGKDVYVPENVQIGS